MSLEQKFNIPPEVGKIMRELLESIIVNKPENLIEWCHNHFACKLQKIQEKSTTVETENQQEDNEAELGTFYCYFTLKSLPYLNHHYYILAFLSNDPFHVTKTLPLLYEKQTDTLFFNDLQKFFLEVDDSILEQCLVLQVYDLENSKQCICELNMDLFHLVRNDTLQWRNEQLTSQIDSEEVDENGQTLQKQPLEIKIKYNWVPQTKEEAFNEQPLPINQISKNYLEQMPELSKGHIIIDWEWLKIIQDYEMDVYFVAFVSNSPSRFIKTGLVKVTKKGKFTMNEQMQLWAEGPFEEETVVVLQVYKSLGVKELIAEKSIQVQKVIKTQEWVKQEVEIEEKEEDEEKIIIGQAMVGITWVKEESQE